MLCNVITSSQMKYPHSVFRHLVSTVLDWRIGMDDVGDKKRGERLNGGQDDDIGLTL